MWKLICYEIKKMIASRSGKIILLLFIGICLWQCQQDIKSIFNDDWNGLDVSQIIETQKSLDGNTYEQLYQKVPDIEKDAIHYNPKRELDEEGTSNRNSFDWKKVYKAYEDHTLTLDMINALIKDPESKFHSLEDVVIHYAYKDEFFWSIMNRYLPNKDVMLHRDQYVYQNANMTCLFGECDTVKDDLSKKEINRRFLKQSDIYRSNYIENNIIDRMNYTNMIILVATAVLFANIFSRETQGKTDTYLACSPISTKTVWAKIIFTLLLGVGLPLLCKLFVFIYSMMQSSGLHWQMLYYEETSMIASYIFTIKELIAFGFINQILMTISFCICILFISQKSKNTYFSAILSLIFVIFPIYFAVFRIGGYAIASYFPSNLLMYFIEHLSVMTYDGIINKLFILIAGVIVPSVVTYWIIWVILDAVLLFWMHKEGKMHRIHHA